MTIDLCRSIVEDFLKNSWPCVETIVQELTKFRENPRSEFPFYHVKNGQRNDATVDGKHFFLRASIEYSTPQLTVEEIQGVIAARLLEVCGNHFHSHGLHQFDENDIKEICETLKKPPQGLIMPFLLNTDDVEPDRYSANPLRESIVTSGQSAYPCATVKTDLLSVDPRFAAKYVGVLVCQGDLELIDRHLHRSSSYVDVVDAVKYEQFDRLSNPFGIHLGIYSMRMPLSVLAKETPDGALHQMIRETHKDYGSIEFVYDCMGRSMKNLTTLITVPHSTKGYASKRSARGRLYLENSKLKNVKVKYQTVLLYENEVDPSDVSVARADDTLVVEGEKLRAYDFKETPSSPQFFLYSLASPENAVLWHGIGEFGAAELLKSYATTRLACDRDSLIRNLSQKFGLTAGMPLQFNLMPRHMWAHPVRRNIDASLGCIDNLADLVNFGMRVEHLPADQYVRKKTKQSTTEI